MTQKEIIEFEEANTSVIRLYLEGSFYKAYERSAFCILPPWSIVSRREISDDRWNIGCDFPE